MSLFHRALGLDRSATDAPLDVDAPLPPAAIAETESVRTISIRLEAMPPARARYVAAFAYLLGRAAHATGAMSDAERTEILRIAELGGLDAGTAPLVIDLAATLAGEYGATEDYLVTREFKAISTMEERQRLLRCVYLVMAADDNIDATESWLANRLAEELDIERPDLNAIREEFHDQLSGVRELRQLQQVQQVQQLPQA
jgi:uncharacterized tellurite resistance protein B-like protein